VTGSVGTATATTKIIIIIVATREAWASQVAVCHFLSTCKKCALLLIGSQLQ